MKKINYSGETIVEVLISIAAVAGVLASSYYLLSRSYKQSQDAVERVAAIKAAESKVELLRSLPSSTFDVASVNAGDEFCLSSGGVQSITDASCTVNTRYTVTLKKSGQTFVVKASWSGLSQATENVNIYYRP